MAELISVIVTTYNREGALAAVLRSLTCQTDSHFEVVVADDGSGQDTAVLINAWRERVVYPIQHIWHEDRGFRAAEIRNKAVLASRGAYCIFLDGDCIVRSDFVSIHRRLAERGYFVSGNRVLLSASLTEKVLSERLEPENWGIGRWLSERMRGGVNRLSALMYFPLGPLRYLRRHVWQGARSCNLAIWRSDFDQVDGFDADYSGWGKEDSDIVVRLLRAGVRRKDGSFATGVIHLWHAEADRSQLDNNQQKLLRAMERDHVRAKRGLSSLR